MKVLIFSTFLLTTLTIANAQEFLSYKVTGYSINGKNLDSLAEAVDVALVFYECDTNTLCFANYWRKNDSYSYGPVMQMKRNKTPETDTTYRMEELQFTWGFFNTYDSISGESDVTLTSIFNGNKVKFFAEVLVKEPKSVIKLEGYME